MCGIIGIIGKEAASQRLVDGLKRLEYRGYDSAGIAVLDGTTLHRVRAEGKIKALQEALQNEHAAGNMGIAHTRWATHGRPTHQNAHPHATEDVAVVHNGIIENFLELRTELEAKGHVFSTETDTEVIPHLITHYLQQGLAFREAFIQTIARLDGAYAIAAIHQDSAGLMAIARQGSPLAIGYGDEEMYIGSDAIALAPLTQKIAYLEEGDIGFLTQDNVVLQDKTGAEITRSINTSLVGNISVGKENYRHYMQKEIFEQPSKIGDVLHAYHNPVQHSFNLPNTAFNWQNISTITMVACGTSFYAASIAKYWWEQYTHLPVHIDVASEFRYRTPPLAENGVAIFISQSGETADTLAAMRYAKQAGQHTLAIVNVPESTMAREADYVLYTYCGPEIGVASTKAFTCQLTTLACLVLDVANKRESLDLRTSHALSKALSHAPALVAQALKLDSEITSIAASLSKAQSMIYMGRGVQYGMAQEGALKLKEISYIHAEATAAGELKHGPIALVDESVPVVALALDDGLLEKTASNIREVAARGGNIVLLADKAGCVALEDVATHHICLPALPDKASAPLLGPLLTSIPIQLLAYHVAVAKGTDIDQPRNLAKSVTVE